MVVVPCEKPLVIESSVPSRLKLSGYGEMDGMMSAEE